MLPRLSGIHVVVCMLLLSTASAVLAQDVAEGKKPRIGTYDNRAIAIAYAASRHNPAKEKMAEFEQAQASGDAAKVKELEAWGQQLQQKLHFQGFGRVPVDELLEVVRDGVNQVAKQRELIAIASHCNFAADTVEIVDITEDLVQLYDPSAKTLQHVRNIRKVDPLPLTQLAKLPAND